MATYLDDHPRRFSIGLSSGKEEPTPKKCLCNSRDRSWGLQVAQKE